MRGELPEYGVNPRYSLGNSYAAVKRRIGARQYCDENVNGQRRSMLAWLVSRMRAERGLETL